MKPFMDQDFLLHSVTAKALYHKVAKEMPILDYHCHLAAKDIYEDVKYRDLADIWLSGDHYKWRLMRAYGVEEEKVTGNAAPYDKYQAWVGALETAIGNPLYHWTHLELQRYFDCHMPLNRRTARQVWNECNEKLASMSARQMILMSNVKLICTTDDPVDDLKYHELLAQDNTFPVTVLPAWRPDKAVNIAADTFADYMKQLGGAKDFAELKSILSEKMDYFHARGCRLSDHGMSYIPYRPAAEAEIDQILARRMAGETLTDDEVRAWQTELLLFLGREYARRDWAMQLHVSVMRNINGRLKKAIGPDCGVDSIDATLRLDELAKFMSCLEEDNMLPRTIGYSLNGQDDAALQAVLFSFAGGVRGKIQHGSAWWFNDHLDGMKKQMKALMASGRIADFVGMLTDSRCFLSYSRHEYFRRILCDLLGELVENGEYPEDWELLTEIVRGVCYENALAYFRFPEKA